MHEASIVASVVRRANEIAREQGAARVAEVTLRVGMLTGLSAEALREHFADAARGTILEGARVHVIEGDSLATGAQDLTLESVELEV